MSESEWTSKTTKYHQANINPSRPALSIWWLLATGDYLFKFKLECNKIKNSVPKYHWSHFKCQTVTGEQQLPSRTAKTQNIPVTAEARQCSPPRSCTYQGRCHPGGRGEVSPINQRTGLVAEHVRPPAPCEPTIHTAQSHTRTVNTAHS